MGSLSDLKSGKQPESKPESNNNNLPRGKVPQIRTLKSLKIYGKNVLIKDIELFVSFFTDSQIKEDIITLIDHYKRTYMNPKRKYTPEGGITDRRNKRIIKLQETFLSLTNKF